MQIQRKLKTNHHNVRNNTEHFYRPSAQANFEVPSQWQSVPDAEQNPQRFKEK